MTSYLLEVTLCWTILYGIYHLMLGRETFFRWNRWYLISTLLLGLVMPVLEIDMSAAAESPAFLLQPITVGVQQLEAIVVTASQQEQGFDYQLVVVWVYWLGVVISLARFGYGLVQIGRLYHNSSKTPADGYRWVATDAPHLPFSFFNNLFWSNTYEVGEGDRLSIVRHEEAHIYQRHSFDIVLLELVAAFTWCIPFVYFYKKALKTTHEYLADDYVTAGFDKKQYGRLLIRQSHPGMQIAISNTIFTSQLKKRIVMLTKTKSSERAIWKYLAALPAVAALSLAFSFTEKRPDVPLLADNQLFTQEELPIPTDTVPVLEEVFKVVEEMPRFPGCEASINDAEHNECAQGKLFEFISKNIKYPVEAKDKGMEGTVYVKFVVEKDGAISQEEIVRGVGGGCDEEVLRLVRTMPKWVPGKQRGRNVRTQFLLPIKFKLDNAPTAADKQVYSEVDEMPVMAGCEALTGDERKKCSDEKLMNAVFLNIKYPTEAREKGVEGMVVAKFVIQTDGSVTNLEIGKSVGFGCDEEVLRVIGQMPRWAPAQKGGKAVASSFILPVRFKLDAADRKLEVMEVFPNPASGQGFNVKFKAPAGKVSIAFYDIANKGGVNEKPIQGYDGTEQTVHIDTKGLFATGQTTGTVVVMLMDNDNGKILGTRKVIVQ